MKLLKDERGIALVTSLMLTLVTLSISMVMLYMVTQSIKTSASEKAYKTALDAGLGGVDIVTKDAIPYLLSATDSLFGGAPGQGYYKTQLSASMPGLDPASLATIDDACLNAKLTSRPSNWGAFCGPASTSLDAAVAPDITFVLKSAISGNGTPAGFKVSAKIISTTVGSTDLSGRNFNTSATTGAPGGDVGSPYLYRLEVTGQRENNPKERANLSVLYAY